MLIKKLPQKNEAALLGTYRNSIIALSIAA